MKNWEYGPKQVDNTKDSDIFERKEIIRKKTRFYSICSAYNMSNHTFLNVHSRAYSVTPVYKPASPGTKKFGWIREVAGIGRLISPHG